MRPDTVITLPGQRPAESRIPPERVQSFSQALHVVGLDKEPAAGSLDNLGEAAATRLHDGHTACHRLEQKDAFRLVVRRRHRENIQVPQKRQLSVAVDGAPIGKVAGEPGALERPLDIGEIRLVPGRQIAGHLEADARPARALPQALEGLSEHVKAFLRREPRKYIQRGKRRRRWCAARSPRC